ncbi:MAG TPA: hypothetical protein V6D28_00360 [Leptolyngbyaceae cyanobacterium]
MNIREKLLSAIELLSDEQLSVLLDLALSLKNGKYFEQKSSLTQDYQQSVSADNKIYDNLDEQDKHKLIKIGEKLRREKAVKYEVADKGNNLLEAKKIIGRGKFVEWLSCYWNDSKKQAERAMNVAKIRESLEFAEIFDMIDDISSLYEIGKESTPDEAKKEILLHLNLGKKLSCSEINKIIKHHKEIGADTVYGFVYIGRLPDKSIGQITRYKIGCTSRTPQERIEEQRGELIHSIECKYRWRTEKHLQKLCLPWHFKNEEYIFPDESIVAKLCLFKTEKQLLKCKLL